MTIIIPMAGHGNKFKAAGFPDPKPFINMYGKTMIQHAIESLGMPNARYILIPQNEHLETYDLWHMMEEINIKPIIVGLDHYTQGCVETCLSARNFIDPDEELIITNADQMLVWSATRFLEYVNAHVIDGCVITVETTHPNYSYVSIDKYGYATQFTEKDPISTHGLVGLHHFRKGSDFLYAADKIIRNNIRSHGEYYMSLTYNMLLPNKKISTYSLRDNEQQIVLGAPWELYQHINTIAENYTHE